MKTKFLYIFLFTALNLTFNGTANAASDQGCVLTTFFNECPSKQDMGWSSSDPNVTAPNCTCTTGLPPKCRITNIFVNNCPDVNLTTAIPGMCQCSPTMQGDTNPDTGKKVNPGESGSGDCDTPLPCTACDEVGWESNGTGYEVKKTGGKCVGNSCSSHGICEGQTIEYRCAPGYCGTTTDGKTGCVKVNYQEKSCVVLDIFENTCPSGVQNCLCTNTYPKRCTVKDVFDTPPSWANSYACGGDYWTSTTTGYEQNMTVKIENDECKEFSQKYRCSEGYYGTTSNGTSGCSKCPAPGTSTAGQNSTISYCYIPSNTSLDDTSGTYIFNSNCYYTN